jgi:hypothetical protein
MGAARCSRAGVDLVAAQKRGPMRLTITVFATLLGVGAAAVSSEARADEERINQFTAPANAFELQMSSGYTQGFGNIFPNTSIINVAGAGVGFTAAVAYRVVPHFSLDLEGQYQVFAAENAGSSQGFNANVGVTMHGTPYARVDPWLRLAAGWRSVWQSDPNTAFYAVNSPGGSFATNSTNWFHGWEIANLRLGLDIRSSSNVAWAPFAGASLQTFLWENGQTIATAQWGTYVYAGLQARFDVGGAETTGPALAKR